MVERVSFFDARDYGNVEWVMLQHAFDTNKPASASIKASIRDINANGREDEFKMLVDDIKKQEHEVNRAEDALKIERPLAGKTPFVYYMPNPNFKFKNDDIVVVYSGRAAVYKYNRTKQVSFFSNNVCKVNRINADGNLNVTTIYGGSEITTQPIHCALLVQYKNRKILIYFHEDRSSMSSISNPVKRRRSSRSSSRSSSGGKKRKRANHTQRRRR